MCSTVSLWAIKHPHNVLLLLLLHYYYYIIIIIILVIAPRVQIIINKYHWEY